LNNFQFRRFLNENPRHLYNELSQHSNFVLCSG